MGESLVEIEAFYLDVDGVMTDGTFLYSEEGKSHKRFGPDDGDALAVLRRFVEIFFVTADHRGLGITRARIERDLGFPVHLVAASERLSWLAHRHSLANVAYMGDSFLDTPILSSVGISIAPANASPPARSAAKFVTGASGGRGAVAEACFYLAKQMGVKPTEFEF